MRLLHYELSAQGRQRQAIQEAHDLNEKAMAQMRAVLRDVRGAISFIISAETQPDNRINACSKSTAGSADFTEHRYHGFGAGALSVPLGLSLPASNVVQNFNQGAPLSVENGRLPGSFSQPLTKAPGTQGENPFASTRAAQQTQIENPFASTRAAQQTQTAGDHQGFWNLQLSVCRNAIVSTRRFG